MSGRGKRADASGSRTTHRDAFIDGWLAGSLAGMTCVLDGRPVPDEAAVLADAEGAWAQYATEKGLS